jgi:hypothetical protein
MKDGGLSYQETVRQFEASYIGHVLKRQAGHRGKTDEELGVHHNTLTRRLRLLQSHLQCMRHLKRIPYASQVEKQRALWFFEPDSSCCRETATMWNQSIKIQRLGAP